MQSWWRATCLALSAVMAVAAPSAAQTVADVIGQTVVSVTFDVEGRPEESPSLHGLSAVKVGDPLRAEDVRSSIARLDGLGLYEGVAAAARLVPGGVAVVFQLEPRHPVTALQIEGDTGMSAGSLRRLLQQRYGGVPTTSRPSAVEATAVQMLNDEGYLGARVSSRIELMHNPDAATLVLQVEAGSLTAIQSVVVRGESPRSSDDIIRQTRTSVGSPFRRREIERALTTVEEDLRQRGYYEAQLTLQATPTPEGVDVVLGVSTGPRVEVRIRPEGALPGGVDEFIPIKQLGSADRDLLEDSRARIERALRSDGYWKATAPFTTSLEDGGDLLVITFAIERGARYFVERVELPSTLALPGDELQKLIGVSRGSVFDEDSFLAGLARVAEAYRRAGYYAMSAEPTYEEVDPGPSGARAVVVLYPMIAEGPAGRLAAVTIDAGATPQVSEVDIRPVMTSRPGQPYVELDAARDLSAIRSLYFDRGFPSSTIALQTGLADDGRAVSLTVRINEGPRVFIGDISVLGNERVSTRAVLDELGLQAGQPAGAALVDDARRRLVEMGVFRRVTVSLADRAPGETQGHLIVNVVESPATSIGIGGGLEGGRYTRRAEDGSRPDRLEFAPRGFFEISRRNLGGRNRVLSFFSRLSLKRQGAEAGAEDDDGFAFTEYRVSGTYREFRAFGSNTDLLFGVLSEQGVRTNFNFARQRGNAELLRAFTPRLSVSGRYALEFTRLFDEQIEEVDRPLIDRLFPEVRLSLLSTGVAWDRRDNPIDPTRGTLVTADVEVAARAIGSQVGYLKTFFQGSAFRGLDAGARTVFASRALFGVARGFPRTVPDLAADGTVIEAVVQDLPASQRFFAGGSTTVRGFQLDRLGVDDILDPNGLSLGGNGVVVVNAELRRILTRVLGRDFGVVGFLDAGNVFGRANDVSLAKLRGAAGFGIRYDSPLGPLRLDFGFKLRPRSSGDRPERGWEYHLSIGEAF